MAETKFTVLNLIDIDLKEHNSLNLISIGDRKGLARKIRNSELNRPGLALSGFFDSFADQRIQVFGRGETAYLTKLESEGKTRSVETFFTYIIPCCVFTHNLTPPKKFLDEAAKAHCPILRTDLGTAEFVTRLIRILSDIFSQKRGIHGTLMEVYGLGVLLLGDSGVGKSETALELIKHGHRLVADDMVRVHCINGNTLLGSGANKIIAHHMEIRGIGVINITHLFGIGAVRDQTQIQLIILLEAEVKGKSYDRMGDDRKYMEILGVNIPKLEIPVKPGRNVPVIVETAAMNERLKSMGYDSGREFSRNIMKWQEMDSSANAVYFGEDII
jgi:HPr kinase/phosphorylase